MDTHSRGAAIRLDSNVDSVLKKTYAPIPGWINHNLNKIYNYLYLAETQPITFYKYGM